jgi:Protein of unknown function (DUF3617)
MSKTRLCAAIACCVFFLSTFASAQVNRKPGLWEMTATTSWQKSPMPPGVTMPSGANSTFGGGAHTSQVCITQAMIDRYGAPVPQSRAGCQVSNIQLKSNSMSADWACTGMMTGKGSVESSWTDSEHATSTVHFLGSMQMGQNATPVEYTINATSVYKGPDCGSVKPATLPDK